MSIFDGLDNQGAEALMAVHGEPVTYYPQAGGSRSITAIVDRDQIQSVPGGSSPAARIMVRNDVTLGITSAEFDRGGDRIGFPINIGGAADIRPAKQMPAQTAGMIVLEVF
jgi:hypothetical protein